MKRHRLTLSDRRSGLHWLASGAVTALLIPVLTLGLGITFALALAFALVAGAGCVLLLSPRLPFETFDAERIGRGEIELARELLAEGVPAIRELSDAASLVRAEAVRTRVAHLATQAGRIVEAVKQDPSKVHPARRFLTYYLPRAAEVADGYRLLERKPLPDAIRLRATSDLLDRLDGAFARYHDTLFNADVKQLDLELKLLGASLDEDLGPDPRGPTNAGIGT